MSARFNPNRLEVRGAVSARAQAGKARRCLLLTHQPATGSNGGCQLWTGLKFVKGGRVLSSNHAHLVRETFSLGGSWLTRQVQQHDLALKILGLVLLSNPECRHQGSVSVHPPSHHVLHQWKNQSGKLASAWPGEEKTWEQYYPLSAGEHASGSLRPPTRLPDLSSPCPLNTSLPSPLSFSLTLSLSLSVSLSLPP